MRALVYPDWGRLEIREVDRPEPDRGEVLIRVAACGICGSEIESVASRSPRRMPPLIMGHEFCGTVVAASKNAAGSELARPGARVVPNAVLHCGDCEACRNGASNLCRERSVFGMHRPGAFAEFVAAPIRSLFEWPEGVRAEAACLAEPLANGIHVARLVERRKPKLVFIIGAGPIGLMCLQAIQNRFENAICVVSDLDERRLEVAEGLGARVLAATGTGSPPEADVVIDAAGVAATRQLSVDACRPGGCAVWIGLADDEVPLRSYGIVLAERTIVGSYGSTAADMREALALMESGRVDVTSWVITSGPDKWVETFERQLESSTRAVKAVLRN